MPRKSPSNHDKAPHGATKGSHLRTSVEAGSKWDQTIKAIFNAIKRSRSFSEPFRSKYNLGCNECCTRQLPVVYPTFRQLEVVATPFIFLSACAGWNTRHFKRIRTFYYAGWNRRTQKYFFLHYCGPECACANRKLCFA